MKAALWTKVLILAALAAYLSSWPVPVEPVHWQAPVAPGYVGVHASNQRLAGLRTIPLDGEEGPEHIALAKDNKLLRNRQVPRLENPGGRRRLGRAGEFGTAPGPAGQSPRVSGQSYARPGRQNLAGICKAPQPHNRRLVGQAVPSQNHPPPAPALSGRYPRSMAM